MPKNGYIVGIDIGTKKITALIGEVTEEKKIEIIGIGTANSRGLRKGVVVNLDATVEAIKKAQEEAELMAGFEIDSAYIGISGAHIKSFNSRGVIAVSGKNREIPVNNGLLTVLEELKKRKKSDFVFPNPKTNKPFRSIRHSFENACRRANIHDLRFHDLRHTFACRMIQKGCDIETLRDLLGHHSISVTERYIHTNLDQKRGAIERISEKNEEDVSHICHMGQERQKEGFSSYLFSVN
jgi:hypothetical protein